MVRDNTTDLRALQIVRLALSVWHQKTNLNNILVVLSYDNFSPRSLFYLQSLVTWEWWKTVRRISTNITFSLIHRDCQMWPKYIKGKSAMAWHLSFVTVPIFSKILRWKTFNCIYMVTDCKIETYGASTVTACIWYWIEELFIASYIQTCDCSSKLCKRFSSSLAGKSRPFADAIFLRIR